LDAATLPDGDADLDHLDFSGFAVPPCQSCGGILEPCVVLFGENVPRSQVAVAQASMEQADAMLIVGSSLMVFRGFASRSLRRAAASRSQPLISDGPARTIY